MNPLSSKTIIEACVLPVCLSGCTNWILTDNLLKLLERLQAEVGRRVLNLSRFHNKLSPLIGLTWPTMRARILSQKLFFFLAHLLDTTYTSLSRAVFHSSLNSDCEEISFIQQCRLLEEPYGTNFTDAVLQGDSSLSSASKGFTQERQTVARLST